MNDSMGDALDSLDLELAGRGAGVVEVAVAFAEHLLELMDEGRVRFGPAEEREFRRALLRGCDLLEGTVSEAEMLQIRRRMNAIASGSGEDKGLGSFARCVANCFVGDAEWQRDSDGPNTPIYYHFFYLDLSCPDAAPGFFGHFKKHFDLSRRHIAKRLPIKDGKA